MEPRRVNFADPDFEPTDDELRALSRAAFADVARQNAEAMERLMAAIEVRRREVTRRLVHLLVTAQRDR